MKYQLPQEATKAFKDFLFLSLSRERGELLSNHTHKDYGLF